MIPRTLVPPDARLSIDAANAPSQRRRPTSMDERTLVPAMLPVVALDGKSEIPANLPLESIAARVVVPRDIKSEAYSVVEDFSTPLQPTDLDERITVPQGAAPLEITALTEPVPTDLIDPDIFLTGEVNLLVTEESEKKSKWSLVTRVSTALVFHALLVVFILSLPKLFPPREKTQEELEIARKQMTILLPPGAFDLPRPEPVVKPREPKSEAIHVDPRTIRRVAPEEPKPLPNPVEPERVVKNLPNAPTPQPTPDIPTPQPNQPTISVPKSDAPKPPVKLETPDMNAPKPNGLLIPKVSPGRAIQDSAREVARTTSPKAYGGGVSVPPPPGGGGQGSAAAGIEVLTPTDGVDFSSYFARMYATVKQNWLAVYPESAQLGERGVVSLEFRIMKDGSVPAGQPVTVRTSGKEPLDRAAISSIRSSNPFERLPSAYTRDYIELRFTYYYNTPIEYAH